MLFLWDNDRLNVLNKNRNNLFFIFGILFFFGVLVLDDDFFLVDGWGNMLGFLGFLLFLNNIRWFGVLS